MADFDREPCFWTSTKPGYNTRDRQRSFMRDGKRVTEKFPQRGHAGDYEDRRKAPGTRYLRMIDNYGNEVFHVLTNAAAHLDTNTGWAQYQLGKARALGWFMPGACPCALLASRELKREHFLSREVLEGTPCTGSYSYENQCPHSIAEQKARRSKNAEHEAERELKMKGEATLSLEATRDMTKQVGAAVQKLVEMQTGMPVADPPPSDGKAKK